MHLSSGFSIWRLSRAKTLTAVESGHQTAELREFLQARESQPLPETVAGFLVAAERQARALHVQGPALFKAIAFLDRHLK